MTQRFPQNRLVGQGREYFGEKPLFYLALALHTKNRDKMNGSVHFPFPRSADDVAKLRSNARG